MPLDMRCRVIPLGIYSIMELVTNYSKDVRKKQLMSILEHPIFEETSNLEEAVDLLQDFVKMKSNNNE